MKKVLSIMLSALIIITSVVSASATSEFTISVDRNVIRVGYEDIYHENPHEEPGKLKPVVAPDKLLELSINAKGHLNDTYIVYLKDLEGNVIDNTKVSGTINRISEIVTLNISGSLAGGKYTIVVDINGETKEEVIEVVENVALKSVPTTNALALAGEKVENLIDGYYMNWVSNKAPSIKEPQEFILDYGSAVMNISSMQVFTNFGGTHGIKRAEILYYNIADKEWKNIKNVSKDTIIDFQWVLNGSTREPFEVIFDKGYETNKIMLRVIESNIGWGNSTVISEIQTWGYQVGDTYDIKQKENYGKEGRNNTVNITLDFKNYRGNVNFELVNAIDDTPLKLPVSYDATMKEDVLEYKFVVPETVPMGEYKIITKFKDITDSSLTYRVVANDEKNYTNITDKIVAKTSFDTLSGDIKNIVDGNKSTSWSGKLDSNKRILLTSENFKDKSTNMIINQLKVYADKNVNEVKVEARSNPTDQKMSELGTFVPDWKSDAHGNYFIIDFEVLGLSFEYQLFFSSKQDRITIYEIEAVGLYLYDNLMSRATVYKNGELITTNDLLDNDIGTVHECSDSLPVEYEFDFAPYTLTSDMLVYAANYPKGQGINEMNLEFYEGNEWKNISTYQLQYQTSNELREVSLLPFNKTQISKMKVTITDANTNWGKFVIAELYALGSVNASSQSIADSITEIKKPVLGQTKLELPALNEEFKNLFTISLATSSAEDVIGLDGSINPSSEDKYVNVTFKVMNNQGDDIGYTKEFTVFIPKITDSTHSLIMPEIDTTNVIKNSSMGWVQYIEGFECRLHDRSEDKFHSNLCTVDPTDIEDYWRQMDDLYEKGLQTSILYIRMPWSWFEPEEGKYAWNDPHSELSRLVAGAKERDLEVAFRVLINSASMKNQAVPEWFFKSNGDNYWLNTSYQVDTPKKEPYLDDPIFLEKFENFVKAFGKEYNAENNNVSFVDGMGYGNWGETESNIAFNDYDKREETVGKIFNMYNEAFPDVLLGAQYGGLGHMDAIENYGYVTRRDAFGSGYLSSAQKNGIMELFNKGVPVYAENCYHHFESMKNNWGSSTVEENRNETLKRVISDALELRANTLDIRVLEDCKLWLENDAKHGDDLLNAFAMNGGYRLAPIAMQIPNEIRVNKEISIDHVWVNDALGFLPNKNSHWNNKYKVSFALLDTKTNKVVYQFNESSDKVNPGDWLKENGGYHYTSTFTIPDTISAGNYKLATAIVNEKLNYEPDINLALNETKVTSNGWYVIDTVNVTHDMYSVIIEPTENGGVASDKKLVEKYDSITLNFTPDKGYEVDKVFINEVEVDIKNNQYIVTNITSDIYVKATFKKISAIVEPEKPNIEPEKPNIEPEEQNNEKNDIVDKQNVVVTGDVIGLSTLVMVMILSIFIILFFRKKQY